VNLTADAAEQTSPVWSPDHEQIAFSQYAGEGDPATGTVVMDRDGSDRRVIVPGGGRATWSPDGTRLAISLPAGGIGIVDLGTGTVTRLTDRSWGGWPAWSPDGSSIAFIRDGSLALVDVDTGDVTTLVPGDQSVEPDWSPDGSWIAFRTSGDISIVRPDGSDLRNLTEGLDDTSEEGPAWSPDGTQIAFVSDRAPAGVYVIDVDGGEWRRVEGTPDWVTPGMDW
jgi:TolB protein